MEIYHCKLFLLVLSSTLIHVGVLSAQATIPVMPASSGASVPNEGKGSVEFSVGQVFYQSAFEPKFNLNEGIQQPSVYELISKVDSLSCDNFVLDDSLLYKGESYNGVMILPYLSGNGANFLGLNLPSTSITGLTLSLLPGKLAKGDGSIELMIKGVPSDSGIAMFSLNFGKKTCQINLPVTILKPKIALLNCVNIVVNPKDIGKNFDYAGIVNISYQGGNNRKSVPISVASTGVLGLTLKADSTLLIPEGGTFNLNLTGKPTDIGTAFFPITIGDKSCNLTVKVIDSEIKIPTLFTPNDDGKNDLWTVPALAFYPESKVFIYDRLGRLLIEYPGSSPGWNGMVNGYAVSAGDYWYVIQVSNGVEPIKGNFTLLR